MTGWDDIPIEMKFEVIQYLDFEDRKNFAKCSFRCLKEVIWGGKKDITWVKIKYITGTNIFVLEFGEHFIKFKQLGSICQIELEKEIIWKGIEDNKNMAYEFAESILKMSKHCLHHLTLFNVDFMIKDESIDEFPCLYQLSLKGSSINQIYSLLSKAKNIISLRVEEEEDSGTIENINQFKLPEDFELLSIKFIYLETKNAHFASDLISRLNRSEDHRFWQTEINIFDEQYVGVDENLMNIFKKSEQAKTNLTMTIEQFVELASSINDLTFDGRNINPSTLVDFMLNFKKSGRNCFRLYNVDDGILEFGERLNFKPEILFGIIWKYVFETDNVRGGYIIGSKVLHFTLL